MSIPNTIGILTNVFCTWFTFGGWKGEELSHEQAQDGVNFDLEVKFDLEAQGQSALKYKRS